MPTLARARDATAPVARAPNATVPHLSSPDVAVLEDDPSLAELAAELCNGIGLSAVTYGAPRPFLDDFDDHPPRIVILDWRLTHQIAAAVFLAVRHRFPQVPVVCWTATPRDELPSMVSASPLTRVLSKADGVAGFESALRWALSVPRADGRGLPPAGRPCTRAD